MVIGRLVLVIHALQSIVGFTMLVIYLGFLLIKMYNNVLHCIYHPPSSEDLNGLWLVSWRQYWFIMAMRNSTNSLSFNINDHIFEK